MIDLVTRPRNAFWSASILATLLMVLAQGCARTEADGPSMTGDAAGISDLLDDWNENGPDPALFVEGKAPADAEFEKYHQYSYALMRTPRVSGTTTTTPVQVYDEMAGQEVGTIDWTFTKVGDAWKIEAAPLP
ncbi:hypothetical protein BH23PLA1_BH23PLA1_07090 [soil metagenome]